MKCSVQQIQVLDDKGYWLHRNIYLNMDENFCKGLQKVVNDKTVPNSYTVAKEVLYVS